jgi:hypothetical protein
MSYVLDSEKKSAFYMTWTQILAHVREIKHCDEREARRQIGNAIEDRKLSVV